MASKHINPTDIQATLRDFAKEGFKYGDDLLALYDKLNAWHEDLDPAALLTDHPAVKGMEGYKEGFTPAITPRLAAKLATYKHVSDEIDGWDLMFMSSAMAAEFAYGWRISAIVRNSRSLWFVTGLVDAPGRKDTLVVFALADEVFQRETVAH
jgi:hypothetical protein